MGFYRVDPLASKMPGWSPYNYVLGNPIGLVDPDGKEPEPPKTIGVFYKGGPSGSGNTRNPSQASYAGKLLQTAARSTVLDNNRRFAGRAIAPGLTSASGVQNGYDFIKSQYQDGDQVVIYGYSYGVDVAMDLATKLRDDGIAVDLLVTVDGSDGPLMNTTVNTTVPDNVKENLNIYQTASGGAIEAMYASSTEGTSGTSEASGTSESMISNGSRNTGSGNTIVRNNNATAPGVTHGNIQRKEDAQIRAAVTQAINSYY